MRCHHEVHSINRTFKEANSERMKMKNPKAYAIMKLGVLFASACPQINHFLYNDLKCS